MEPEPAWYGAHWSDAARFAIYEESTWHPLSTTALGAIDHRNGVATFVILMGDADAPSKGYVREATRLMLDDAFNALGLHSVMPTAFEFNLAEHRAHERAGFKEVGRGRQCRWLGG